MNTVYVVTKAEGKVVTSGGAFTTRERAIRAIQSLITLMKEFGYTVESDDTNKPQTREFLAGSVVLISSEGNPRIEYDIWCEKVQD